MTFTSTCKSLLWFWDSTEIWTHYLIVSERKDCVVTLYTSTCKSSLWFWDSTEIWTHYLIVSERKDCVVTLYTSTCKSSLWFWASTKIWTHYLIVSESKDCVVTLYTSTCKSSLWVWASTKIWTHYLIVSESKDCVVTLYTSTCKSSLWVWASTKIWTHYLIVSERKLCVVLYTHLPVKAHFGFEPVPRCEHTWDVNTLPYTYCPTKASTWRLSKGIEFLPVLIPAVADTFRPFISRGWSILMENWLPSNLIRCSCTYCVCVCAWWPVCVQWVVDSVCGSLSYGSQSSTTKCSCV